jgi:hypothetical protein
VGGERGSVMHEMVVKNVMEEMEMEMKIIVVEI